MSMLSPPFIITYNKMAEKMTNSTAISHVAMTPKLNNWMKRGE